MDFLEHLEDNSLLIIPGNLKEKVLTYIANKDYLINCKIIDFNELKKGLLFDYSTQAIYYIMQNEQVNYDVAINYLKDMYYIQDEDIADNKWQMLKRLKNDLLKENMLIMDALYPAFLQSKTKLYVYGYDYITKFNQYLLDLARQFIPIQICPKKKENYVHTAYKFMTMEEEVTFVAEKIAELKDQGISFNQIYIANYSDEYYFTFRRIFRAYNIPFFAKKQTSLYETAMGQYFINHLTNNLNQLFYRLEKEFDCQNNVGNVQIYNKLFNLVNDYYWCGDITQIKELIISDMRARKVGSIHFSEEIKTINILNNDINDDEYVFLIGFNLGSIPKMKKDEDFINDKIKNQLMETTTEFNKCQKEITKQALKNIKNLTITYKMTSAFNTYYASYLLDNKDIMAEDGVFSYSHYAEDINKLSLAQAYDNFYKFNEINANLTLLHNNYKIPYNTYDNQFSGVNEVDLQALIDNNLVFSYSNISKYYECPFKFYIASILKINEFEEKIAQFIGDLFHKCLEKCVNKDEDIDEVYNAFIAEKKQKSWSYKEEFFADRLREEIHFIIDYLKEQNTHSHHQREEHEKEILLDIERENLHFKLKGFVDKVLFFNNHAIIIDYKTGNEEIEREKFTFGLSMQLPIYLYLLKCLDDNIEIAGLYIQHILDRNIIADKKKDYAEEVKKTMRLDGITFNDENLIKDFDDTYEKSTIIKGLSIDKQTGELKENKHVMSLQEREDLIKQAKKVIEDCISNVIHGHFPIHPLKCEKVVDACKYCDYIDICYRRPKDFNYQEIKKEEVTEHE